jgi:hypothetical protein
VLLGTFAAYSVEYFKDIAEFAPYATATINGENIPVTYSDIPALLVYYLSNDTEFLGAVIKDVVLGLLFSFIGVFSLLKNSARQPVAQPTAAPEFGKEDGNV